MADMVVVSLTLANSVVYVGSSRGLMYAPDAVTSELLWRSEAGVLNPTLR